MQKENEKKKEIEKLDKKIDENLNATIKLGGAGLGTVAGTFGFAAIADSIGLGILLPSSASTVLGLTVVGGLAATGLAVIPLTIAAGYGIRKLVKNI